MKYHQQFYWNFYLLQLVCGYSVGNGTRKGRSHTNKSSSKAHFMQVSCMKCPKQDGSYASQVPCMAFFHFDTKFFPSKTGLMSLMLHTHAPSRAGFMPFRSYAWPIPRRRGLMSLMTHAYVPNRTGLMPIRSNAWHVPSRTDLMSLMPHTSHIPRRTSLKPLRSLTWHVLWRIFFPAYTNNRIILTAKCIVPELGKIYFCRGYTWKVLW